MSKELIWKAIYSDDTILNQINEDGSSNKYIDIDRTKLIQFLLYQKDKLILVIHLDEDKKLIFRRRVAMKALSGEQTIVYLVGWQQNRSGVNQQQISFIFEDGHIEVTDRFKEGTKWFYPINFMKDEQL